MMMSVDWRNLVTGNKVFLYNRINTVEDGVEQFEGTVSGSVVRVDLDGYRIVVRDDDNMEVTFNVISETKGHCVVRFFVQKNWRRLVAGDHVHLSNEFYSYDVEGIDERFFQTVTGTVVRLDRGDLMEHQVIVRNDDGVVEAFSILSQPDGHCLAKVFGKRTSRRTRRRRGKKE